MCIRDRNSPLCYVDENGEFFFSIFLGPVGAILDGICWGAVIGAGASAVTYSVSDVYKRQPLRVSVWER